jgi:hypothetical protein
VSVTEQRTMDTPKLNALLSKSGQTLEDFRDDCIRRWSTYTFVLGGPPRFTEMEAPWLTGSVSDIADQPICAIWPRRDLDARWDLLQARKGRADWKDPAGTFLLASRLWDHRDDEALTAATWFDAIMHEMCRERRWGAQEGFLTEIARYLPELRWGVFSPMLGHAHGYHHNTSTVFLHADGVEKPTVEGLAHFMALQTTIHDYGYALVAVRAPRAATTSQDKDTVDVMGNVH